MSRRQIQGAGYAALAATIMGLSWRVMAPAKMGDIDPLSALLSFAGTVVAVCIWRSQQADTKALSKKLAVLVRKKEQPEFNNLLGGDVKKIDTDYNFRLTPGRVAKGAAGGDSLEKIVERYREIHPSRMIITGEAGGGKTVLAIDLILRILKDRKDEDPVPVRVPATSWDFANGAVTPATDTERMENWLVTHLIETYKLSRRSARALVDECLVLPVVDGLDELDATDNRSDSPRARQALEVFNNYQSYNDKAALIVTCRKKQYEALKNDGAWLKDAAELEILPVSAHKACNFIKRRVDDSSRWKSVLDAIDPPEIIDARIADQNGPPKKRRRERRRRRGRNERLGGVLDVRESSRVNTMAESLSTPWRLTLAVTVYEQKGKNPDDLVGLSSMPDAFRGHLLDW